MPNADLKELSKAVRVSSLASPILEPVSCLPDGGLPRAVLRLCQDAAQELYEATIDDDSFMSVIQQLAKEPRVTQKRVHSVVQRASSLPNKHKVRQA